MDCLNDDRLLAYSFGALADEDAARADAHLCACVGCLRAYLALKHQLERGAERSRPTAPARPSEAMRARLRADVEAAFRPGARARVQRALRHPIPLYQGLVAAAFAVALALPLAHRAGGAEPGPSAEAPGRPWPLGKTVAPIHDGARVDTARLSPESLTIY
jgi:anti-sigma factor RsiW